MKLALRCGGVLLSCLIAACVGTPTPIPQAPASGAHPTEALLGAIGARFGERQAPVSSEAIFSLDEAQAREFLAYFHDPAHVGIEAHERVYGYLEERLSSFQYHGATLTASEAWRRREGNCLSLAVLTTALARLAEVRIDYQRVTAAPVFERRGDVVLVADHVRSRLHRPPPADGVLEMGSGVRRIVIDYFPDRRDRRGGVVDDAELMAMFHRNLAGEALVEGDFQRAFWLIDASLRANPDSAASLNSLAVLLRRAGDAAEAERVFLHALDAHGENPNLLRNYRALLISQSRFAEARMVALRLERQLSEDSYGLVELAEEARREGHPLQALAHYSRALEMAPYLHEAYWGRAVVHAELGQGGRAGEALQSALEHAPRLEDRRRYQAKLMALEAWSDLH